MENQMSSPPPSKSINEVAADIHSWANSVFPNRTPQETFSKLVFEEIPEIFKCQNNEEFADEYADSLILLLDLALMRGVNVQQAIDRKMAVNRGRTWKLNPHTGIHNHV